MTVKNPSSSLNSSEDLLERKLKNFITLLRPPGENRMAAIYFFLRMHVPSYMTKPRTERAALQNEICNFSKTDLIYGFRKMVEETE